MQINIAIVGGGIIGSSIFYYLSQKYKYVALLEKQQQPVNSTVNSGAMVRCFYNDFGMTQKAYIGYSEYQKISKNFNTKFHQKGLLFFTPYGENLQQQLNWLNQQKYSCEYLDIQKGKQIFPQFQWLRGAVYEHLAGYYNPITMQKFFVQNSQGKYINAEVKSIKNNTLDTNIGNIQANIIIIATGAWTPQILKDSNIQTNIYSKAIQLNHFKTSNIADYPCYIDNNHDVYGRPNNNVLNIGSSTQNTNINPDTYYNIDEFYTAKNIDIANIFFTQNFNESDIVGSIASFDAYSDDFKPVVKKHENIIIASGCSGGGFKLAPAIALEVEKLL